MLENLAKIAVWLLLAVSIVVIGWEEPLRYKFMTEEAITQEERLLAPTPVPAPPLPPQPDWRTWQKRPNPLDTDPNRGSNGMRR